MIINGALATTSAEKSELVETRWKASPQRAFDQDCVYTVGFDEPPFKQSNSLATTLTALTAFARAHTHTHTHTQTHTQTPRGPVKEKRKKLDLLYVQT